MRSDQRSSYPFGESLGARAAFITARRRSQMVAETMAEVEAELKGVRRMSSGREAVDVAEAKVKWMEGIAAVRSLHTYAVGSYQAGEVARHALAGIALAVVDPYRGRVTRQPSWLRYGQVVEVWIRSQLAPGKRAADESRHARGFAKWWTFIGFAVTVLASALIVVGDIEAALVIISFRILISGMLPTPGFAGDSDSSRGPIWQIGWSSCVVGHLTDAVALSGVAGYLMRTGYPLLGWSVGIIPLLMLSSTLLRVAALQDGIWLQRLYLERVFRSAGLLFGLAAAIVAEQRYPGSEAPVIAVAGLGALTFAVLETVRTVYYAQQRSQTATGASGAEILTSQFAVMADIHGFDRAESVGQSELGVG